MTSTRQRLLVIEDDPITRTMIATYFAREGYQVDAVGSIAAAQAAWHRHQADLLLVDIHLPDGDGLAFAQAIRRFSAAGIIFVTSRDSDRDRVLGLELVGDDYVTKPLNLRELLARARSLLRRRDLDAKLVPERTAIRFGRWLIDLTRRELAECNGGVVRLTRGEFDLLAALVTSRGRTVTRDYLVEVISNRGGDGSERSVDALIARLRRKLESDPHAPTLIRTVPGSGYRLDAEIETGR
jgi:two-component system, OmpR family, torCAD operon response regulator TorR